jgi:hypothetical protein
MTRYATNNGRVVSETLDGEVLMIDMASGAYSSCVDATAVVWTLLANGATVDEAAALLVARYGITDEQARAAFEGLAGQGTTLDLLRARGEGEAPAEDLLAGYDGPEHAWGPMALDTNVDLADLILLDPVHDVTAEGWPNTGG